MLVVRMPRFHNFIRSNMDLIGNTTCQICGLKVSGHKKKRRDFESFNRHGEYIVPEERYMKEHLDSHTRLSDEDFAFLTTHRK